MMRAIMAAVGRALRAILGILWMPFEVVGSIFSGFGGSGSADPQEQAASVARNAAREERAMSRGAAPKPGIDDPMLVKEIAVRMAAGKPLPEGAKVSRAVLEALSAMPKGVLKQFTAAHLHTVQAFIEGLKKNMTAPRAETRAERAAPELRSRVAARVAARPGADGNAGPSWGWAAS